MEKSKMEKAQTPLEAFQTEMQEWLREELQKKAEWEARGRTGAAYNPHADVFRAEFLTDLERNVWNKIKDKSLTRKELNEYDRKLQEEVRDADPEIRKNRFEFRAFIGNQAHFIGLKELEDT